MCVVICGFFIFYFHFLQKYIFVFEIYRNIPRPPRRRAAGTWSPRCGAAGAFLQKISRRIYVEASGVPVARQRGGRLPLHYLRVRCPHPLFALLKLQKKEKREGERRNPAGFSSRRLQITKILIRFTNRLCCNCFC